MRSAIMQPTYLPWLGYFDLIDKVDVFVFYDDVQLTKRSWQVRNRIATKNGEQLLTVPIKKDKSRDNTYISNAKISYDHNWVNDHLKALKFNYSPTLYFDEVFKFIKTELEKKYDTLSQLNTSIITNISNRIGLNTRFLHSSNIGGIDKNKDYRLAYITKKIGSTIYLSPKGSADYIESRSPGGALVENNTDLYYHCYNHPTYNQLVKNFVSHMSVIDLVFNEGFDSALEIIRSGRKDDIHYSEFRKNI